MVIEPMVLLSVTRLRLRSARFLLPFGWYTVRSAIQAKRSSGNLGLNVRKTSGFTFWTLTMWESDHALRAFRIAQPHGRAMRKLPYWCDEASYAHWEQESRELPPWERATAKLSASGRLSKVLYPSADHEAGRIATS